MTQANQFARKLRRNSTDAERAVWGLLRDRRLGGHKFRRQVALGPYIVDFVCFDQKIVVEVDGGQHQDRLRQDQARSEWLESQGFTVLRFWNNEVIGNQDGVAHLILTALEQGISPSPQPSPVKGEGVMRRRRLDFPRPPGEGPGVRADFPFIPVK